MRNPVFRQPKLFQALDGSVEASLERLVSLTTVSTERVTNLLLQHEDWTLRGVSRLKLNINTILQQQKRQFHKEVSSSFESILTKLVASYKRETASFLQKGIGDKALATILRTYEDAMLQDLVFVQQSLSQFANRYIQLQQQRKLLNANVFNSLLQQAKETLVRQNLLVLSGRQYDLSKYSGLLMNQQIRRMASAVAVKLATNNQVDLVQVDVHAGSCDKCLPYQGKIYSLSGKSDLFPPLLLQPPYHPNCWHYLIPITIDVLKDRNFDKLVEFSNSDAAVATIEEFYAQVREP